MIFRRTIAALLFLHLVLPVSVVMPIVYAEDSISTTTPQELSLPTVPPEPPADNEAEEGGERLLPAEATSTDSVSTTSTEDTRTRIDSEPSTTTEEYVSLPTNNDTEQTEEESFLEKGIASLTDLSKSLAAAVADPLPDLAVVEVQVIYDLDVPIVLRVEPLLAVVVPEETVPPPTFLESVVEAVVDWFSESDSVPESTSLSDEIPGEAVNDVDIIEAVDVVPEPPVSDSNEPTSWWWSVVYADEIIDSVEQPLLPEDVPVVAPDQAVVEVEASTTTIIDEEVAIVEVSTATSTLPEGVIELMAPTSTDFVFVGTTSLQQATLETSFDEEGKLVYQVVLPPGSLSVGMHTITIATTTPVGEIREQFIVDVGGGLVREYYISPTASVLVVVHEDGAESLWLRTMTDSGLEYHQIANKEVFKANSPLTIFDDVLFYLDPSEQAIHGYDIVLQNIFSFSIEMGVAAEVTLATGRYFVDVTPTDFQFVSVVPTVY